MMQHLALVNTVTEVRVPYKITWKMSTFGSYSFGFCDQLNNFLALVWKVLAEINILAVSSLYLTADVGIPVMYIFQHFQISASRELISGTGPRKKTFPYFENFLPQ
jgi:hypothetical protein